MALMGLVFGVLIGGGSFATAAKPGPAIVDYSQCADGKFVEGRTPPDRLSEGLDQRHPQRTRLESYHEDQVTLQRLTSTSRAAATHTFDLSLARSQGRCPCLRLTCDV